MSTIERHSARSSATVPSDAVREVLRTTPEVEIREVRTRADLNRFIDLPWSIYKGDQSWVPPLRLEVKDFLNRKKHPFFRHGSAAQFLALQSGQCVGRILVSDDPNFNIENNANVGCFGMFESVNDPNVGRALLDTATAWSKRWGRTELRGPIDYSMSYPCGLLVDGFDTPQRVMMNHNPAYYESLLTGWGLRKAKDLYAWWFDNSFDMVTRWAKRAQRLADRAQVRIRSLSMKNFDAEVELCNALYNQMMEKSWGFVAMTPAEFRHHAEHIRQIADPDWILIAEVDGQPAGFCLTIPDVNEAIRPLNGRLTRFGIPIGFFRLLYNLRRVRTGRLVSLGVLPQFRSRGIAELFILHTIEIGERNSGITRAELGWTLEDNDRINAPIEKVGGQRYKTFRIFSKAI